MSNFCFFGSWIAIISSFLMTWPYDRGQSRLRNLLDTPAMRCLYVSAALQLVGRLW